MGMGLGLGLGPTLPALGLGLGLGPTLPTLRSSPRQSRRPPTRCARSYRLARAARTARTARTARAGRAGKAARRARAARAASVRGGWAAFGRSSFLASANRKLVRSLAPANRKLVRRYEYVLGGKLQEFGIPCLVPRRLAATALSPHARTPRSWLRCLPPRLTMTRRWPTRARSW